MKIVLNLAIIFFDEKDKFQIDPDWKTEVEILKFC